MVRTELGACYQENSGLRLVSFISFDDDDGLLVAQILQDPLQPS